MRGRTLPMTDACVYRPARTELDQRSLLLPFWVIRDICPFLRLSPDSDQKRVRAIGECLGVVFVNDRALGGELSGAVVNANPPRSGEACASGYWNSHRLES
jgi:hypothetical protein